jgi:hypothetical protein
MVALLYHQHVSSTEPLMEARIEAAGVCMSLWSSSSKLHGATSRECCLVCQVCHCKEAIDELKYSPDGTKLAAGSHDNFIDIYNAADK